MAKIVVITPESQKTGEPQTKRKLGCAPFDWCKEKLSLDPEPIVALGEEFVFHPNGIHDRLVVVMVYDDEGEPGQYRSDRSDTEVKELLGQRET